MKLINLSMQTLATRMAVVWFVMFTFAALGNSIITAFYGIRWVSLDWQDRIMIGILILVNWLTTMMAFFSKAISRAQQGEFPLQETDGELIQRKSEVEQRKVVKVGTDIPTVTETKSRSTVTEERTPSAGNPLPDHE